MRHALGALVKNRLDNASTKILIKRKRMSPLLGRSFACPSGERCTYHK